VDPVRDTRRTYLARQLSIYADELVNIIDAGTFNPGRPHLTDWIPLWVDCGLDEASRSNSLTNGCFEINHAR
jgi:hypothetical protein